jgi:outer membrane protein assembly factor BamA
LSYDTFYGLRGQSYVLVTDYLGNHSFIIGTDIVNSINQSNLQLVYLNSTHRTDFGVGAFHNKNYFQDNRGRLFSDRTYGLMAMVQHPFSLFRRVQVDFSHLYIDRTYYDPRIVDGQLVYDDANQNATTFDLSLVHDNVLWGYTGPVNGSRWKLRLERTVPLSNSSQDYWAGEVDYRKYFHLGGQYSFAFRLSGGASFGSDKKVYYLGGNTNYVGSTSAGDDVYSVDGFYFSKIVTPLRGYDYFDFQGSKYAIANVEFRYPFVEYLALRFPLPLVLARVSGAAFFDLGAAWNRNEEFKLGTSEGPDRIVGLKSGFGTGVRANLGFFLLRYDLAWAWDLAHTSKPKHYISFGAEF